MKVSDLLSADTAALLPAQAEQEKAGNDEEELRNTRGRKAGEGAGRRRCEGGVSLGAPSPRTLSEAAELHSALETGFLAGMSTSSHRIVTTYIGKETC